MNTNETRNQISIAVVKNMFQEMFQEHKLLQYRLFKAHEEARTV